MNRHVTNEKMANNYEMYSVSVVIRETPFKKANETNKQKINEMLVPILKTDKNLKIWPHQLLVRIWKN